MVRCHAPWGYYIVDINGDVSPCCFHYGSLGNLYKNSIEEIWNGEGYANLRRALILGTSPGCADCPIEVIFPEIKYLINSKSIFIKNYLLNGKEFEEGETYLESKPIFYSITTSTLCNLKCSFCCQNKHREEELGPLSEEIISSFKQYYKFAHIFSWVGGETLMQTHFIDFLEESNPIKYPDMCLKVTTNGTLLNTMLFEKFNQFKQTLIVFSIDGGTKEVYEKLRVGANWGIVIENLKRCMYYMNIKPTVQYTVMRSNVLDILNAVILFSAIGVEVIFCPVVGMDLLEENIFRYPGLLKGINWEIVINSSLKYAEGATKESLEKIKSKLIKESILWGKIK